MALFSRKLFCFLFFLTGPSVAIVYSLVWQAPTPATQKKGLPCPAAPDILCNAEILLNEFAAV